MNYLLLLIFIPFPCLISCGDAKKENDSTYYYNKGNDLFQKGNYEEAIKCFNNEIEINPDIYEAWYNKGVILQKLGKNEEAIKCYDKAIEIKTGLS